MIKNFKWLLLVSLTFVACNNDDDATIAETPASPGTANFSKYVALGDSFAAGYSDNALFKAGQKNAYPNILAQQFAFAEGGVFLTPFMDDDNVGGFSSGGNQIPQFLSRLFFNGSAPVNVSGVSKNVYGTVLAGPFNNMGVPGAKSFHLSTPGYGALNPYFGRFASSVSASIIGDAVVQKPTFFSLWIGGNDVLGYATSGGIGVNQTGNLNPATYGGNDITDPNVFANVYSSLVTSLSANGAKGVVANLPYVNTLPYFTTVPYNPLTAKVLGGGSEAVGQATITALNAQLYGPLKQALTAFQAGNRINLLSATVSNPILIKDESLPNLSAQLTAAFTPSLGAATAAFYGSVFGQARQATATDLVLLPTQSAIGAVPTASDSGIGMVPPSPLNKFGITFPLQDKHVLIPTEVAEVKVATDAYNITIKTIADAKGLAFVDTKAIMTQLSSTGIESNSFTLTSTYVTGGAFSLDGIHPSPRGYALIANAFMMAINTKFSSTLKLVDLGLYPILYPAVIN